MRMQWIMRKRTSRCNGTSWIFCALQCAQVWSASTNRKNIKPTHGESVMNQNSLRWLLHMIWPHSVSQNGTWGGTPGSETKWRWHIEQPTNSQKSISTSGGFDMGKWLWLVVANFTYQTEYKDLQQPTTVFLVVPFLILRSGTRRMAMHIRESINKLRTLTDRNSPKCVE